jgi:hypothetical protein
VSKALAPATPRGRPFANGNPGRRPGSKNRNTVVASALLDGESEELVRLAIERAKAGNVELHKFLLIRIMPRERLIKLELPQINFADDAVEAHRVIMRAVCEGQITPNEGAALATLVNSQAKAIETADVVKRPNRDQTPTLSDYLRS